MKAVYSGLLVAAVLSSCILATVEEPSACKNNILTFTTQPLDADAGISVPSVAASTQVDISNMVSNLADLGTVSLAINQDILSLNQGDFSWMRHLTVTIVGVQNPIDFPLTTLSSQDVISSGSVLKLNSIMSGSMLYGYLSQGAVELTFTATGPLPTNVSSVDVTQQLCVRANVSVHKGI